MALEPNTSPAFPFNQTAVELHTYSLISEEVFRGRGLYPYGVGFGEEAPAGRRAGAFYNDAPWIDPPPGSQQFERQGTVTLPAVSVTVQNFIPVPGAAYRVPKGCTGMVWQLQAANVQNTTTYQNGSGTIVWRLQIDKRPVDGYSLVTTEVGTRQGERRWYEKMGIEIFQDQLIEWLVWNQNAPVGNRISCMIGGMIYPIQGR